MRWHKTKRRIKPHIKKMKMRPSWVDYFDDKVNLERLNHGRLLYSKNMSFHGMCCKL
jgi:hypothetical protein